MNSPSNISFSIYHSGVIIQVIDDSFTRRFKNNQLLIIESIGYHGVIFAINEQGDMVAVTPNEVEIIGEL